MNVTVGQQLRLKEHVGYRPDYDPAQTYSVEGLTVTEADLARHDPLFAGQEAVVEAIVPAEVDGAGTHDEDHAVLVFQHHDFVAHGADEASPVHQHNPARGERRVSFTQAQLDTIFEPVDATAPAEVA